MVKERTDRQQRLVEVLRESEEPRTGTELAQLCHVTRQVVVHDIALLRAAGVQILSTPRGYWLTEDAADTRQYILAVNHPPELAQTELFILVDHGVTVVDVMVEHAVYGELRGGLELSSRRDVELFLESVRRTGAPMLSSLTDGFHFHTVKCDDVRRVQEAVQQLKAAGIHVEDM